MTREANRSKAALELIAHANREIERTKQTLELFAKTFAMDPFNAFNDGDTALRRACWRKAWELVISGLYYGSTIREIHDGIVKHLCTVYASVSTNQMVNAVSAQLREARAETLPVLNHFALQEEQEQ